MHRGVSTTLHKGRRTTPADVGGGVVALYAPGGSPTYRWWKATVATTSTSEGSAGPASGGQTRGNLPFGSTKPDSAATRYLFTSTAFLGLGAVLWLAALAAMRFPNLIPFSYGRLRPMALIVLLLGWLVLGLSAAIFYTLPRLTGSPLRGEGIANLGLIGAVAVVLGGVAVVALGFGDGREPFALPWWWDVPVVAMLGIPGLVTLASLAQRREGAVYPTLWFAVAGTIWLPVMYVVGNLPGLRSLASTLGDLVSASGLIHVWGLGVASGVAYYVVPKASNQPLASRQLARVGFWSVLFGAVWSGPAQLVASPGPEWLPGVAAVLGLALPVGAVANATNLALTAGPDWAELRQKPVIAAALAGSGVAALATVAGSIAGFRSAAVLIGFTVFWEGTFHLLALGGILALFASFAWHAIPNLVGRMVESEPRASRLVRRVTITAVGTALFLTLAGLASGFGWAGAAYTGVVENSGEGWRATSGLPGVLVGLALVLALLGAVAHLGVCASIYRSLTSGRATTQEVLVRDG
jgi:cbb3-type cytochrome oxidase subunit 1